MALTRKFLEGLGIGEKQIESIIEAHSDSLNGIKSDRDKYKEQASKLPDLQKQLEEAKAASGSTDEWQKKFDEEHQAFESFKQQIDKEKAEATKAKAYRAMLVEAGVDPNRIDTVMRVTNLNDVKVTDGKLEDIDNLKEAAKKEWADFIVKQRVDPSNPAEPPHRAQVIEGADPDIAMRMRARHEQRYGKVSEN